MKYWLLKVNEHSLHSPFLYRFYTEVIKNDSKEGFEDLAQLRNSLLESSDTIAIQELGAGSRVDNGGQRKVKDIARHASTPAAFSRLLYRIIQEQQFSNIVELGTSLGLNTLYLQKACKAGRIHTFEGSPETARLAKEHFAKMGATNVEIIEGNIDDTLTPTLSRIKAVDLAYLDANHRYAPTVQYFEALLPKLHQKSILVLDDIHWSAEMNKAWQELRSHPEVTLSLDLFEGGLLFFNKDLKQEHYILSF